MKNLKENYCVFLILIVLFIFFSCGSKKEHKEIYNKLDTYKIDSISLENLKLKSKILEEQKKTVKNNIITQNSKIKLTPVNEKLPIDLVDDSGAKTSIYNAKIDIENDKKIDNTETTETKKNDSEIVLNKLNKTEKKLDKKSEEEEVKSDLDKKSNWFLILAPYLISLSVFVVLLLIWIFRKKIPYIRNFF